jgi:hypothetical protein
MFAVIAVQRAIRVLIGHPPHGIRHRRIGDEALIVMRTMSIETELLNGQ